MTNEPLGDLLQKEAEKMRWKDRLYNEHHPECAGMSIHDHLIRMATNRTVFLSIVRMTEQSKINLDCLVSDFIKDGQRSIGSDSIDLE